MFVSKHQIYAWKILWFQIIATCSSEIITFLLTVSIRKSSKIPIINTDSQIYMHFGHPTPMVDKDSAFTGEVI